MESDELITEVDRAALQLALDELLNSNEHDYVEQVRSMLDDGEH